MTVDPRFC